MTFCITGNRSIVHHLFLKKRSHLHFLQTENSSRLSFAGFHLLLFFFRFYLDSPMIFRENNGVGWMQWLSDMSTLSHLFKSITVISTIFIPQTGKINFTCYELQQRHCLLLAISNWRPFRLADCKTSFEFTSIWI